VSSHQDRILATTKFPQEVLIVDERARKGKTRKLVGEKPVTERSNDLYRDEGPS